ncbi:MAG TPA: single-stranded DNA-binding protein [Myxococcota bacterium]|nr:single-stranded DNA-binding protein [Myxococcota bacterium]HRV18470.1 single-stranded DNA-binding protein [Myxococcota bacterium]
MFQELTLVGFIAKDADMRYTPSGVPFCSFSLPINKRRKDADGQTQEQTTWFRVTVWRAVAENLHQFLVKGKLVVVTGELEIRMYTDRDGNKAASLEVTAQNIRLLPGGGGNGGGSGAQRGAPEEAEFAGTEDVPF